MTEEGPGSVITQFFLVERTGRAFCWSPGFRFSHLCAGVTISWILRLLQLLADAGPLKGARPRGKRSGGPTAICSEHVDSEPAAFGVRPVLTCGSRPCLERASPARGRAVRTPPEQARARMARGCGAPWRDVRSRSVRQVQSAWAPFFRLFLWAYNERIAGSDFSRQPRRGEAQGCAEQRYSGASPKLRSEMPIADSRTKQTSEPEKGNMWPIKPTSAQSILSAYPSGQM